MGDARNITLDDPRLVLDLTGSETIAFREPLVLAIPGLM
jgi:hypothetical protein